MHVVPKLLTRHVGLGTAAMLWVGGGILVHGFEELHIAEFVPHIIHDLARRAAEASGAMSGIVEWLVTALGGAMVGLVIGGIIVAIVRQLHQAPRRVRGRVNLCA